MTATILDGKQIAATIRSEIGVEVARFQQASGILPTLHAILVGDDPASRVYVRNKELACKKAGIGGEVVRLPVTTSQSQLLDVIQALNADTKCHGILVQLPVPSSIETRVVLDTIAAEKDVDCFSPVNVGLLSQGRPRFLPCTPHGILQLLGRCNISVLGKHVVVVGRSEIVGKPIAMMLAQSTGPFGLDNANATVTLCHSKTQNLGDFTRSADILVVAIGRPNVIVGAMIKPGSCVIDVGINQTESGLCGDVDFASASEVAGSITPVPGGIGPLTIAMLLHNTLLAAKATLSTSQG